MCVTIDLNDKVEDHMFPYSIDLNHTPMDDAMQMGDGKKIMK